MTLSLTPYDDDDSNGPDDDDDNDDDDSTRPDDDDDNDDDSTRPTLGGLRPPLHFNPIFHHFLPDCRALLLLPNKLVLPNMAIPLLPNKCTTVKLSNTL